MPIPSNPRPGNEPCNLVQEGASGDDRLKSRTAGTVKWNLVDRLSTQVLYAVTGIVLARVLSQEDFGLVGALLVFQAFAVLLVDSGFSYALIQRKNIPSRLDYSSVLWFNLGVALFLYVILFLCAPLIARVFQNDYRLVALGRVMFLTFIFNAASIVQTNMMMRRMDVKYIAVANCLSLIVGGALGIWLALTGFGAWALVWQAVSGAAVKSLVLWLAGKWLPLLDFSFRAIKSFFGISLKMLFNSFLYVLFQNIFSFFIGHRVGMTPLGYYTQSDKWSKMGVSTITGVMTASFLPALSSVQDNHERFCRVSSKMTKFTAYMVFPSMIWLAVIATPLFHLLFGPKWDASIMLFQLLLVRGIFISLNNLYTNFLLALGYARDLIWLEILRDGASIVALVATFPYMSVERPDNPVWGLAVMLGVQVGVAVITWLISLWVTSRRTGMSMASGLRDLVPYLALSLMAGALMALIGLLNLHPALVLTLQGVAGIGVYCGALWALKSVIQRDVLIQLRIIRSDSKNPDF